ncbi:hypothetical protein [Hyalangium rubrum]|uniref:Lipoprotein n=1 Tax=Hyalangium rubrum TaxID=3103134 RepID=A0ABU5H9N2_9BACT|nr:hypothetical protein [Hyalangium sp. s54d21]MDY7229822.1 hypothetical protein [Hyalangium sp. s54d21]
MQLRKTLWMLTALSAMSLVMTGCPEDGGGDSLTCTSAADCLESEICHPTAKVCVQTCDSGSDCPDTAKTCKEVSTTDSTKVCQCATDTLCNTGRETADLVCSTLDKVCTEKCTSDAACGAGRTCDTATGQCKAGSTGPTCTYGSCASGEVCGITSGKCEQAATCTGEAQSTCTYGQFCSTGRCADVAKPTCGNLEGKAAVNFTPSSGTGNIIYNVAKVSFAADPTGCPGSTNPVKVVPRISFYAKEGTVPATEEGLSGFFYVRTDKQDVALNAGNLFNYTRSADGKSGSISAFLCIPDQNSLVLGFYFTNGNGYCTTFNR